MSLLKKMMDPKSTGDLNTFIENLPQNAGQTVLIAAGIAWAMAGAAGLYAFVQAKHLTDLRTQLQEAQALQPIVPKLVDMPVDANEMNGFLEKTRGHYPGLTFNASGANLTITSDSTSSYAQFREAIGHVHNGGSGWKVKLEKLCVGRECAGREKLGASLSINKVSVENPTM